MKMIAEKLGLDPLKILKAADDKKFHKYILRGLSQAGDDKIFGVPTFIYGDQMYMLASILSGEEAINDVVAYINTLQ